MNLRGLSAAMKKSDCVGALPTSPCPKCAYDMDSATCVEKEKVQPSSGDLSVCFNCGEMLIFNDILVLQPIPQGTVIEDESKALLESTSKMIKQRGRIR